MDQDFQKPELRCDFPVTEKRKKIWAVQLDLLEKLMEVCAKYHLRYFAANGTLLGAVRHGGFIPWDDDVDIVMPREDYDRLIQVAEKEFRHPYFLHFSNEKEDYYRNYMRLRNENTTAIPMKDFNRRCSKGMFIDIFPLDGCCENGTLQKLRFWGITLRSVLADTYIYYGEFKRMKAVRALLRLAAGIWCGIMGYGGLLNSMENLRRKTSADSACQVYSIFHGNKATVMPAAWYREQRLLPFEHLMLPVPAGSEDLLTMLYGDYMQLPPSEKRGQHHEIFMDPDRPYADYTAMTREEAMSCLNDY